VRFSSLTPTLILFLVTEGTLIYLGRRLPSAIIISRGSPYAREAAMASVRFSYNHHWIRRTVQLGSRTVFHRQRVACGRDLVIDGQSEVWRAVHVGLLDFDFLDDETSGVGCWSTAQGGKSPRRSTTGVSNRTTRTGKQISCGLWTLRANFKIAILLV
jgi:hypothetical protein